MLALSTRREFSINFLYWYESGMKSRRMSVLQVGRTNVYLPAEGGR